MSDPLPPADATANWQQRLLLLAYYHALAFGLISLRFDFRYRRIMRPLAAKIYAAAANCCIIVLIPVMGSQAFQAFQFHGDNQLVHGISIANGMLQMLAVTLTLLSRGRRERALTPIVMNLLQLERRYFDAVPRYGAQWAAMRRHFRQLFYVKCFSVAFLSFSTVCSLLQLAADMSVRTLAMLAHIVAMVNVLSGVMWHYYLLLWHMARRFCLLNVQLQRIVELLQVQQQLPACNARQRQKARELQGCIAAEIDRIALTHYRLTHLVLRLNASYQYLVIVVLLALVFNHISMSYFAIILFVQKAGAIRMSNMETAFGVLSYALILLDMFLVHVICDGITVAAQQTAVVLQRFQELRQLDVTVERSCDFLAQQLRQHKVRINIAGMFSLNKRVALVMFCELIKNTVILVQWDMERKKERK